MPNFMEKLIFGSDAWIAAFKNAINTDQTYKESARRWEGDFWFVVEPDNDISQAQLLIYLDLWHGECRSACVAYNESEYAPEFRISGTFRNWQRVIEREVDPIRALMTNSLRVKGNLAKIVRNVRAAQALVLCAAKVPTMF